MLDFFLCGVRLLLGCLSLLLRSQDLCTFEFQRSSRSPAVSNEKPSTRIRTTTIHKKQQEEEVPLITGPSMLRGDDAITRANTFEEVLRRSIDRVAEVEVLDHGG